MKITAEMVDAVSGAICCHPDFKTQARAAIAAVAPLILEQAAKIAEAQGAEDEKDAEDNLDPASGHGAYRADEIAAAIRALGRGE